MAVILNVRGVAEERGIKNPRQLSIACGVPYAACHAMWNGEQKQISFETLNRLCTSLAATPGELFIYEPDSYSSGNVRRTAKLHRGTRRKRQ